MDFARFRGIGDEVGAILLVDMAHFAGLVAGGVYPSPVPFADVVTSTTHKTLRGPRGGFVLTNDAEIAKKINSSTFPGLQGGPLMHVIAAKAVAFGEALQPSFRKYSQGVVENCRVLTQALADGGLTITTGGTDCHLAVVDLRAFGVTGNIAEKALESVGITLNKNAIPNDPEKPMVTSGIRVGSAAGTSRGFGADDYHEIATLMLDTLEAVRGGTLDTLRRDQWPRAPAHCAFPVAVLIGGDMSTPSTIELSPEDIARFGSDPATMFAANLKSVQARIKAACQRSKRNPDDVRLLPDTKTVPAHILRLAYAAGISDFGENKLQEARDKQAVLSDLTIRWSIIGHLQTNKVKYLVRLASEFHALDSFRLAEKLNRRLDTLDRDLDVFVQVNTSGEESKYGLHPDDLMPFIERLSGFPRLKPRGLMTLAIFSSDMERVRACFRSLRELRDRAVAIHPDLTQLSLGMSGDFEIAIEEGANVVRVGQAIFGARSTGTAYCWPGFASDSAPTVEIEPANIST